MNAIGGNRRDCVDLETKASLFAGFVNRRSKSQGGFPLVYTFWGSLRERHFPPPLFLFSSRHVIMGIRNFFRLLPTSHPFFAENFTQFVLLNVPFFSVLLNAQSLPPPPSITPLIATLLFFLFFGGGLF